MLSFKDFLESSAEQIAKVQRLYDNPGTPGEKNAAGEALKRMKITKPKPKTDSLTGRMNKVEDDYKGNMFKECFINENIVKAYHGTSGDLDRFHPYSHFTSSPSVANSFAKRKATQHKLDSPNSSSGANIIPVHIDTTNFKTVDHGGNSFVKHSDLEQAKKEKYHGYIAKNAYDAGETSDHYIPFKKETVKSALSKGKMYE